ncbi:MAG: hypothetical protein A4S12_05195 [Proteobacteria bacterium SG_bin5]|nr:hypothetical protein [Sphingomonas sp.]OQW43265.1 MAG: hypothetical protein A4S12_05195 [Proteobacteria bacterium SG_bin5]
MLKPIAAALLTLMAPAALAQNAPACTPSVEGRLELIDFESKLFPGARQLRIWLPPGYDAKAAKAYPVLYLFDGQNLFDRCTGYGGQEWTADEVATRLIAAGKIAPMVIVGIDNGGAARAREYLPYPDPFDPDARQVEGEKLARMLREEVLPLIARRYHVSEDRAERGLGGSSYGGIATLHVVRTNPDLFGRALIESPSLQVGNGQLLRDAADSVTLPARLFIGIGDAEIAVPADAPADRRAWAARINAGAVAGARRLAVLLSASMIPSAVKLSVGAGAHHNEAAWGARLPAALIFLFGPAPQARR